MAGSGKLLLVIGIAACTHASTADTPQVSLPPPIETTTIRSTTVWHDFVLTPQILSVMRSVQSHCGLMIEPCDAACAFERQTRCATPLVVAFEPIELAVSNATFAFTPGLPVRSAWPTGATPWIVLDRDGDGAITSGAELFGDSVADARDGFEALAQLDDNGDGIVDRRDAAFAVLRLWRDDGDRISQARELTPLSGEIAAIPLAHDGVRGSAQLRGGRAVDVIDLYLRTW